MNDTDYPVRPARGEGSDRFDDRALFFLSHRRQIEEWAGLAAEASAATSTFLESMTDDLNGFVPEFEIWTGPISRYRCVMASARKVSDEEVPLLSAGLCWTASTVTPDVPGDRTCPFVGVYLDDAAPDRERIHGQCRAAGGADYKSSERWPLYRYVPAGDGWWTELDGYRAELLAAFAALIEIVTPHLVG